MAYTGVYAIRFSDVDHAKILYYPRFLHYFHCTLEDFFEHGLNMPYTRVMNEHRIGFPAVHVEVDFKSPLRFGDHVAITMDIRKLGNKSVTWGYRGERVETGEECVTGTVATAVMNMDTFRAIPIPPQYRKWFEPHVVVAGVQA